MFFRRQLLSLPLIIGVAFTSSAQVLVRGLRTENSVNPIGIGTVHPRLSWQLESIRQAGIVPRGIMQVGYELVVLDGQHQDTVWHIRRDNSAQSIWVQYTGPSLISDHRYRWSVRVWDNHGHVSPTSDPAFFQTGLLAPSDWKASWIGPGYAEDSVNRPSPLLRKRFNISKRIVSATLYITARGLYEAQINGQRIGDALFTPGWTDYDKRLQYQAYDVTSLLRKGGNVIGVTLGDGWYRGVFGPQNKPNNYGKDAALLCALHIRYSDGRQYGNGKRHSDSESEIIVSDGSWKSATGPIRYADLYNGEVYDASKEIPHWAEAGYDDGYWQAARVMTAPKDNLVATISPPVRRQETFSPIRVFTGPKGEQIIDFGQNLAGWVEVRLQGHKGDTVRLSHAELLDKDSNFFTGNLRQAKAMDTYILGDEQAHVYTPHFTSHGFRYVKVEGIRGGVNPVRGGVNPVRGGLNPADFRAVAIYSDLDRTGTFECSNPLINQLYQNLTWSQKGNFLDIPTDCPQRSERLGWTGDAQVFCRTAAFNMNVYAFLSKWLVDLASDQGTDGGMPNTIPNLVGKLLHRYPTSVAGWGDAAVILPWTLYECYGDTAILVRQYASMKAWVNYIQSKANDDLWTAPGYGDWYAPRDATFLPYIDQCFWAHSTELLARAAQVLGRTGDAANYTALLQRIKAAFLKAYIGADGRAISHTQTAYVLALHFDLLPDSLRSRALTHLVDLIHTNHDHLATGFLGTPYLLHVLSDNGYADLAYRILLQDTPPSWLYPLKKWATTIWEKWDAIRPDGSIDTCSLNHYAYGAVGDWLYGDVAGIQSAAPGYAQIVIRPQIGGGFTWARAAYQGPHGLIRSAWAIGGDSLTLDITIPANTRATIYLPPNNAGAVKEGGLPLPEVRDIVIRGIKRGTLELEVGSGEYHFIMEK